MPVQINLLEEDTSGSCSGSAIAVDDTPPPPQAFLPPPHPQSLPPPPPPYGQDPWDIFYRELSHYAVLHGNANISPIYVCSPHLRAWISQQRECHRKGTLADYHTTLLQGIGFEFDTVWEERFGDLLRHIDTHEREGGHVSLKYESQPHLCAWVSCQMEDHKKGKLSEERAARLRLLDFHFEGVAGNIERWEKRYCELAKYAVEHGNTDIPRQYHANKKLALWIRWQRECFRSGKLSDDRKQRLELLNVRLTNMVLEKWEVKYEELVAYSDKHGNANVPQRFRSESKPHLGTWVTQQRVLYKRGKLPQDRFERLQRMGFKFDLSKFVPRPRVSLEGLGGGGDDGHVSKVQDC